MEEPLLPSPMCEKELEDVMVQFPPRFLSKSAAKQLNVIRTLEFHEETADNGPVVEAATAANDTSLQLTNKRTHDQDFETTVRINSFQWSLKSPLTEVSSEYLI
jgi:hypothetical protein